MQRFTFLLPILLFVCTTLSAQDHKVLSWNVWNGFGRGKQAKTAAKWIAKQAPDVLALQELVGYSEKKLAVLAKQWDHPHVAMAKERGYPVGLTSRTPIQVIERRTKGLHHGYLHARTAGIDFLVVHLNPHDYTVRVREAGLITKSVATILKTGRPLIVLGDFNAHSRSDHESLKGQDQLRERRGGGKGKNLREGGFDYEVLHRFEKTKLVDLCVGRESAAPTYPSRVLPHAKTVDLQKGFLERIDYVFADAATAKRTRSAKVGRDLVLDSISDHYPILVTLSARAKPAPTSQPAKKDR